MKKFLIIFSALMLAVTLSACGKKEGKFDVENGKYFAVAQPDSKGYAYYVIVEVKDKFIKSIEWNAYNVDGGASKCLGDDKISCSESGTYGLDTDKGTWDEQAKKATDWIVDKQKLDVTFTDGKTDAISSVSIGTEELFDLVEEALDSDAVAQGDYEDGYYYIESAKSDKDYAYHAQKEDGTALDDLTGTFKSYTFGTFVIVNGTIVLADFNATQVAYEYVVGTDGTWTKGTELIDGKGGAYIVKCDADGKPLQSFKTKDVAGSWYGMDWAGQAKKAEAKLLADQELTITVANGSGTIDGVTGVSVSHSVASFKEILDKLNEEAK